MKNLKELAVDHPYYCSDSNYYSNEARTTWDTWGDFYSEFQDADLDMNLVFRWDVKENEDGTFYVMVFMMHQRKGRFVPHYIKSVDESDINDMVNYMSQHWGHLKKMWEPISMPVKTV